MIKEKTIVIWNKQLFLAIVAHGLKIQILDVFFPKIDVNNSKGDTSFLGFY